MNMRTKAAVALSVAVYASGAVADEKRSFFTDSGLEIIPMLESGFEYNDNIGRVSANQNPDSSYLFTFNPGIAAEAEVNGNEFRVSYEMGSGFYFDSSKDNYLDHSLKTDNKIIFNSKNQLKVYYALQYLHDERGTGLTAGDALSPLVDDPVQYLKNDFELTYVYGSDGAKGRLEPVFEYSDKRYRNYRDLSGGFESRSTRYKDFQQLGAGIAFYYRPVGMASLLLEASRFDKDYALDDPDTSSSLDNVNTYYYIGATWDITGQTRGKVRLGHQDKSYADSAKQGFSGTSWTAEVTWTPLEISSLKLSASQKAEDPDQSTSYIEVVNASVDWKHYWKPELFSDLSLSLKSDDYSDSARNDELYTFKLDFGYAFREYLNFVVGWRIEDKKSSFSTYGYRQNLYTAMAEFNF